MKMTRRDPARAMIIPFIDDAQATEMCLKPGFMMGFAGAARAMDEDGWCRHVQILLDLCRRIDIRRDGRTSLVELSFTVFTTTIRNDPV